MSIIALSGRAGSGKDTYGREFQKQLLEEYGQVWEIKKFADPLKQMVATLCGTTVAEIEKDRNAVGIANLTYRQLLQQIGTDLFRNQLHPDIWVEAAFKNYNPATDKWIFTDMRFPNEHQAVTDRKGLLIRLEGTFGEWSNHPSETALNDTDFEWDVKIEVRRFEVTYIPHLVRRILKPVMAVDLFERGL